MLNDTTCITYNNPTHERFQQEFERLYRYNFTNYHAYKRAWIEQTDFFKNNQQVFKYEKYAGYFLWKPFCIKTALDTLYTDRVLYCDSNLRFKDFPKFEEVFYEQIAKEGVFFVKHRNFINKDWTKRDAFFLMTSDDMSVWSAHQVWSVILGFDRSEKSKSILDEYLFYCRNPYIVTELPNACGLENLPGFKEHRWEQSVISILAVKYGIQGVWDTDMIKLFDKVYDKELYKYKEEVNKDPLKKVNI